MGESLGERCPKCGRDNWGWVKNGPKADGTQSRRKRCLTCKNNSRGFWASRRITPTGRRAYDQGAPTTLLHDTLTYSEVMKAREKEGSAA